MDPVWCVDPNRIRIAPHLLVDDQDSSSSSTNGRIPSPRCPASLLVSLRTLQNPYCGPLPLALLAASQSLSPSPGLKRRLEKVRKPSSFPLPSLEFFLAPCSDLCSIEMRCRFGSFWHPFYLSPVLLCPNHFFSVVLESEPAFNMFCFAKISSCLWDSFVFVILLVYFLVW